MHLIKVNIPKTYLPPSKQAMQLHPPKPGQLRNQPLPIAYLRFLLASTWNHSCSCSVHVSKLTNAHTSLHQQPLSCICFWPYRLTEPWLIQQTCDFTPVGKKAQKPDSWTGLCVTENAIFKALSRYHLQVLHLIKCRARPGPEVLPQLKTLSS